MGLHAARLSSFQSEKREWKMPKSPFWETVLEVSGRGFNSFRDIASLRTRKASQFCVLMVLWMWPGALNSLILLYTHIFQLSCSKEPVISMVWSLAIPGQGQSQKHALALRASRETSVIPTSPGRHHPGAVRGPLGVDGLLSASVSVRGRVATGMSCVDKRRVHTPQLYPCPRYS